MSNRPKSTKLKLIEGNPGKRPLNMNEPEPMKIELECPSWFDDEAKKEWERIVPELTRLGLLTIVDKAALENYCIAYSRWADAEAKIAKHGLLYKDKDDSLRRSPYVLIANKYSQLIRAFCIEFGLTPSSRVHLSSPSDKDENGMEGLLD